MPKALALEPAQRAPELLDVLADDRRPVVVAFNANGADGRDPSWLWDVPFERLRGRTVIATGERSHDLAVRLKYADVEHRDEPDLGAALALGREGDADVVATYTAFGPVRDRLARA